MLGIVPSGGSVKALTEYLNSVGCNSLNVGVVPENVINSYKLQMTPTTVIIGNDGVVEEAWAGKWTPSTISDAEKRFGIEFKKTVEKAK